MEELYWITRLDNIYIFLRGVVIVSVFTTILSIAGEVASNVNKDDICYKRYHRYFKYSICALLFSIIGMIFIPSTKDAIAIYSIGGTIDYIKDNNDVNQLPDKCIKALDTWLESLNEEKK